MNLWLIALVCTATGRNQVREHWPPPLPAQVDGQMVESVTNSPTLVQTLLLLDGSRQTCISKLGLTSSIMGQLDAVWRHSRLSLTMKLCLYVYLSSAVCSDMWVGSMDNEAI